MDAIAKLVFDAVVELVADKFSAFLTVWQTTARVDGHPAIRVSGQIRARGYYIGCNVGCGDAEVIFAIGDERVNISLADPALFQKIEGQLAALVAALRHG